MDVTPARRAALRARLAVAGGRLLDHALGDVASGLEDRDRGFLHELLYGTTRLQGRLDHLLDRRVRGGLDRLDPPVLETLRLGAYEAFYMDGVPDYATRSQAVELAKEEAGRGAGGLVNAVLRRVVEDGAGPQRFPALASDPLGHLTRWGSHPEWMVRRWLERWDVEAVLRLVERNNARPDTHLVPLDVPPEEGVRLLAEAGIEAEVTGGGTGCVCLASGTDPVAALDVLPSVVQDPGANLVPRYADLAPGTKVADLCAAPGGKALVSTGEERYVVAADRGVGRMGLVRDNARRTGRRLGLVVADAARPPLRPVDAVLLDVPCTGTGTLGRHPDGRWRLDPSDLDALAALQDRLLEGAASVVKPGGYLVYSTCSLEPEENEDRVDAFLARHDDFRVEDSGSVPADVRDEAGRLRVLPQDTGFDGAFAARLRRRG